MLSANLRVLSGCLLVLLVAPVLAEDGDAKFYLATGVEYTTGSYGGDADIEDFYLPISATFDYGNVAFRLTVPYLSVRAPEGTQVIGPGGEPIPGTGDITTNSGLGDISGSVTFFDVIRSEQHRFTVDLKGTVKFGTADTDKGLGTGETDFSVQADFLKFLDRAMLLGSIGYKVRGDPAAYDLEDTLLASAGVTYRMSPDLRGGVIFDYREASRTNNDSIRELTGFVSRRVSEDWRLMVYLLAGSGDSGPDWGAGFQLKRTM